MSTDNQSIPSHVCVAKYDKNQVISRYRDNPLIEALPPILSEDETVKALELYPQFDADARNWPTNYRLHELHGLEDMMIPLRAHLELDADIDRQIRQGLVGRRPNSKEHVAISQAIYDHGRLGMPFRQKAGTVRSARSSSLIGMSGMGKSISVKRSLARIPQVIYHPDLDIYQVTYLHVETPENGASVKALAIDIIAELDRLVPGSNYYSKHVGTAKIGGDVLIRIAAQLMNKHFVGILVLDEIQNLGNARKDDRKLMAELTGLCNVSAIPQLYIGTYKARKILGHDYRQGRRSLGMSKGQWDRLPQFEQVTIDGSVQLAAGDWSRFLDLLWKYQYVLNLVELTPELRETFYELTQGNIDLTIKLFIASQATAMHNNSEVLSEQNIRLTYARGFQMIHPMIDALRRNDLKALANFDDVIPDITDLLQTIEISYEAMSTGHVATRAGDPTFEARVAATAQSMGFSTKYALAAAKAVADEGTAKDMVQATQQLIAKTKKPSLPKTNKGAKSQAEKPLPDYSANPKDYRNAVVASMKEKTTVMQQMAKLRLIRNVEDLVCID
jgi:hypothetical protein